MDHAKWPHGWGPRESLSSEDSWPSARCFFNALRWFEVGREWVFLFAAKSGFHFKEKGGNSFCFDFQFVLQAQDVPIMSQATMTSRVQAPWNVVGKPKLCRWLVADQTSEDRDRLKCLGNIVMPRVAQLGAHLLEHRLRGTAP